MVDDSGERDRYRVAERLRGVRPPIHRVGAIDPFIDSLPVNHRRLQLLGIA